VVIRWKERVGDLKMKCENCLKEISRGIIRDGYSFCTKRCHKEWIHDNRLEYLGTQYSSIIRYGKEII